DKIENYEILFAVYGTEDGAAGAVASLKAMDKAHTIDIVDAATLVKDVDGNTTVKQESLPSVKKGVGIGALIGGAVGLLFPPSIIATAALGAGIGAGSAKLAKMALENDDLKDAAANLEPGSSAFIAVVENTWVTQLQEAISGYQDLAAHQLDAEASGVVGMLASEGEAAMYGNIASDEGVLEFALTTDGETIAGQATTAALTDDGTLVVEQISGVATADADGNVAGVVSETVAAIDVDGNAVVAHQVEAGYAPAELIDSVDTSDEDVTES
ncbi:MAG: DUF1269 domain-containing protein, partial [Actinomycetia bacterium]|nr:DUF1269 domain-containing protein [Actinomycetes bacterium]